MATTLEEVWVLFREAAEAQKGAAQRCERLCGDFQAKMRIAVAIRSNTERADRQQASLCPAFRFTRREPGKPSWC